MTLRKPVTDLMALTLAAFGLIGCGNSGESAPAQPAGDTLPETDVVLPSEEEANAEAATTINEENADEVFNELTEEIDEELEDNR
jgi:hypothetical protein